MKTLYTLLLTLLLVACANDYTEANGISSAFLRSCKTGSIRTTIQAENITKTLTITCNKDGY